MAKLRILQLDTGFPRPAGDIASADSYLQPPIIEIIPQAFVRDIVSIRPDNYDISGFTDALQRSTEPLIITSCGFMIYWQDMLADSTYLSAQSQFFSSSLIALPELRMRYDDNQILVVSFDAQVLNSALYRPYLGSFQGPVMGLDTDSHLYETIRQNSPQLNVELATRQVIDQMVPFLQENDIHAILLECTNLSVYKPAIRKIFSGEIIDLLQIVESHITGLVKPAYL
jgi:hypothetical protein